MPSSVSPYPTNIAAQVRQSLFTLFDALIHDDLPAVHFRPIDTCSARAHIEMEAAADSPRLFSAGRRREFNFEPLPAVHTDDWAPFAGPWSAPRPCGEKRKAVLLLKLHERSRLLLRRQGIFRTVETGA